MSESRVRLKDGSNCRIRSAEERDAAAAVAFLRAEFATVDTVATSPDEFTMTEETERAFIAARRSAYSDALVLAEVEHEMVGVMSLIAESKRRLAHNVTLGIIVGQKWRDRGVGRAMVEAAVAWARTHPTIERVCLAVSAGNPRGVAVYEKCGFVVEGRRLLHFQPRPGVYEDDLIMACRVKPLPDGARGG